MSNQKPTFQKKHPLLVKELQRAAKKVEKESNKVAKVLGYSVKPDLTTTEERERRLAKKAEYRLRIGHNPRFKTAEAAFWAHVNKTDSCWLWTGHHDQKGYGRFVFKGKVYKAHRFLSEPIPAGMMACHSCDVPACVNPAHIFIGTNADNMADAARKGRMVGSLRKGTENKAAKMNETTARWVRPLLAKGFKQRQLAQFFGVTQNVISRINLGKGWKHLAAADAEDSDE